MSRVNHFLCRICGECCSGDMKVFLNPHDITLILAYFFQEGEALTEDDLYKKRLLVKDCKSGHDMPRLNFKKASGIKFCPFLENRPEEDGSLTGLCRLHSDYKPLICHLAPLAREIDFETDEEIYSFVPPHPACPGCDLTQEERIDQNMADFDRLPSNIKERLQEEKSYFWSLWRRS